MTLARRAPHPRPFSPRGRGEPTPPPLGKSRAALTPTALPAEERGWGEVPPPKSAPRRYRNDLRVVPRLRGLPLFGDAVHHFFRHELCLLKLWNNLAWRALRVLRRAFDLLPTALQLIAVLRYYAAHVGSALSTSLGPWERARVKERPRRCTPFMPYGGVHRRAR